MSKPTLFSRALRVAFFVGAPLLGVSVSAAQAQDDPQQPAWVRYYSSQDTISALNPYRPVLDRAGYSKDIFWGGLSTGILTGVGVGAAFGILIFATTEEGSWDRLAAVYVPVMLYPIVTPFATAWGVNRAIRVHLPEIARFNSGAGLAAGFMTLSVYGATMAIVGFTEAYGLLLVGAVAGPIIGARIGTKHHLRAVRREAEEWDIRHAGSPHSSTLPQLGYKMMHASELFGIVLPEEQNGASRNIPLLSLTWKF